MFTQILREGIPFLQTCLNEGLQLSSLHTKQDMSLLHVAASIVVNDEKGGEGKMCSEEVVQFVLDQKLIDVNECSKVGMNGE